MTPRDPDLCPALELSRPSDDTGGDVYREDMSNWWVLFGDGAWYPVTVRVWREDRFKRELIDVEFFADLATWSATYVADRARMWDGRGPKGARTLGTLPGASAGSGRKGELPVCSDLP